MPFPLPFLLPFREPFSVFPGEAHRLEFAASDLFEEFLEDFGLLDADFDFDFDACRVLEEPLFEGLRPLPECCGVARALLRGAFGLMLDLALCV